jgi:hypothetical protein
VPYCVVDDLLLDPQFNLPRGLSKEKYVQYGADKIDARLGRLYETPLMKDWTAVQKEEHAPTVKLLQMINQHLSSGMIICAMAMSAEDSGLNAYGASLIAEANRIIDLILENEVYLEGAAANPNLKKDDEYVGPRPASYVGDSASATEAFYNMVNTPGIHQPAPFGNLFRPLGY